MKFFARDPYRTFVVARRVIVNLHDETTIAGYVTDAPPGVLVLRGAELLVSGAAPVSIAGEVLIDRADVSFIQVPPGTSKEQ